MTKTIKKIAGVATLLGLATLAIADSDITSVTTKKIGEGLEVAVQGENLTKPRILRVIGNTSYIVEFSGNLRTQPNHHSFNHAGVKYVEYGWYSARPPKVRIHLKVDPWTEPAVTEKDGTWFIRVNVSDEIKATAQAEPPVAFDNDAKAMAEAIKQLQSGVTSPVSKKKETANNDESKQEAKSTSPGRTEAHSYTKEQDAFEAPQKRTEEPIRIQLPTQQSQPQFPSNIIANRSPSAALVSLDFVNTDVIQILKALSMQVGVNIVAAPSVSPEDDPNKLSVTLDAVPLDDALNFITAMSGLRYATVGNTFFVTKANDFSTTMRNIMDRTGGRYETRVVQLQSGEASHIKEATVTAMPPDGREGFYEIIVPGERKQGAEFPAGFEQAVQQAGGDTGNGEQAGQAASGGQSGNAQPFNGRSQYLMLVGEPRRLDDVHEYITELDGRIATSISVSSATAVSTTVVPIVSGETERIKQMLWKVLSNLPGSGRITIEESALKELAEGEESTKILLMVGPPDEISTLKMMAMTLDEELCSAVGIHYTSNPAERERYYEVVDLNYIEPVVAEFDLKSRVRGLQVSILPDPVTPGIKGEDEGEKQANPQDIDETAQQEVKKDELKRAIGREPMRLLLRGTTEQINEAKAYLVAVDVRPAQVALELRVMELSKEEALRVGLDWSLLSGGKVQFARVNQGVGGTSNTAGNITAQGNFFGSDAFDVLATLDDISNSTNLIARPNALVTDGRGASWFVGDTIRYIETIQSTQNGITIQVGEVEVGVTFNVMARIGGDGNIAIDLEQAFSFVTGFTPVPGGGQLPQTSDRKTTTFVNINSGETIALGGLIQENDVKRVSGVPLLKDIPIIGWLFKRTETSKIRKEIVFFLSANVVEGDQRAQAANPMRPDGQ